MTDAVMEVHLETQRVAGNVWKVSFADLLGDRPHDVCTRCVHSVV